MKTILWITCPTVMLTVAVAKYLMTGTIEAVQFWGGVIRSARNAD